MKIKPYSWILGGAYFLCGEACLFIIPKLQSLLSETGLWLPPFTRGVFAMGTFGWLWLMLVMGALTILKDLRFRTWLLNLIFTVIPAALACSVIVAMMLPPISSLRVVGVVVGTSVV